MSAAVPPGHLVCLEGDLADDRMIKYPDYLPTTRNGDHWVAVVEVAVTRRMSSDWGLPATAGAPISPCMHCPQRVLSGTVTS